MGCNRRIFGAKNPKWNQFVGSRKTHLNGILLLGLHFVESDETHGFALELLFDGIVMRSEFLVDVACKSQERNPR